jgi:uncharacterized protein YndB with AHSA1/START domain
MPEKRSETRELLITRVFDAPRALVFETWSKPEHLVHWWGPAGFTLPTHQMEFRPGGAIRFCMRSPEGHDHWMVGAYREIVQASRIVFVSSIDDDPSHQVTTTVMFTDEGGKTKVTVQQLFTFESDATRGAEKGWASSLDRLLKLLAQLTAASAATKEAER